MNKRTRHNRNKNKKLNKSKRYYGGAQLEQGPHVTQVPQHEGKPPGIFDVLGDKLATYSGKVAGYVKNKGLRLVGLQEIKSDNANDSVSEVDNKIGQISNAATNAISGIAAQASAIGADVVKVADGTSAAILENVNDVLESPKVEHSVVETAQQTAKDAVNLLNKVNEALDTPELKAAAETALNNAAAYTSIAVDAMDKPIDKVIDKVNESGAKAAAGVASGFVRVATDAAAAVPGAGAIIDIGKMVNDGSAAVGKVVEAASTSVENISDAVEETTENFKEGIEKLNEAKHALQDKANVLGNNATNVLGNNATNVLGNSATNVLGKGTASLNKLNTEGINTLNRVHKSMDAFHNPLKNNSTATATPPATVGGRKTRRKLFKRKAKSKRVRFAL
jgi:hypothetical protein